MSDENMWSPEPWRVDGADVVLSASGGTVVESPWTYPGGDLRRIVACVNACAGLPVEALEAGALADLIADVVVMRLAVDLTHPVSVEAGQRVDAALRALGVLP
jgi:hypothetical protein